MIAVLLTPAKGQARGEGTPKWAPDRTSGKSVAVGVKWAKGYIWGFWQVNDRLPAGNPVSSPFAKRILEASCDAENSDRTRLDGQRPGAF